MTLIVDDYGLALAAVPQGPLGAIVMFNRDKDGARCVIGFFADEAEAAAAGRAALTEMGIEFAESDAAVPDFTKTAMFYAEGGYIDLDLGRKLVAEAFFDVATNLSPQSTIDAFVAGWSGQKCRAEPVSSDGGASSIGAGRGAKIEDPHGAPIVPSKARRAFLTAPRPPVEKIAAFASRAPVARSQIVIGGKIPGHQVSDLGTQPFGSRSRYAARLRFEAAEVGR